MRNRLLQLLTLVLLLLTAIAAKANPVDVQLAREVGAKFISANTAMRVAPDSDLQLIATYSISRGDAAFHVFNTPKGFVIVAADDCAYPILGYSEEGQLDPNDIPIQMQEYLQGFVEQIQYGIENHVEADATVARQWELVKTTGRLNDERATNAVAPLLTTKWNQNCHFNDLCPEDSNGPCGHVYAGCVATAMAQVMYFWGYPTNGNGSHSYTPSGYPMQTANFGATTYDWNNMNLYFHYYYDDNGQIQWLSTPDPDEVTAVATLIWHCGVAVDMMYAPNGSGAYSEDVPYALQTYFGYSDDMHLEYKDDDASWLAMVKANLDEGKPLYYSGSGSGGHAFVCDGYNSSNQLHFNWGWSGSGNGYFNLGALTPGSDHNYSNGNAAIFNIHPDCTPGTSYYVAASAIPSNGGTVTGSGSYSCRSDCTLTATPANDYMFCSWTEGGEVVSTEPTYSFIVTGARNLVANFVQSGGNDCTLVFTLNDSYGDGWNGNALTVSYSEGCVTNEQLTIENGNSATFTRNVVDGSHIVLGWISGQWQSECSFTVSYADGSLIYAGSNLSSAFSYEFDVNCSGTPPTSYTISATANPTAGGTVSGAGTYNQGQSCTLTATPATGYDFLSWTKGGTVVSANATYTFTVTETAAYVANFTETTPPAPTLEVVAEYYPDANDPYSPCVKVSWNQPTPPSPGNIIFTEGFENGLNGWTVLTVNADGGEWLHSSQNPGGYDYSTLAHSGAGFAMCYSFVDYVGAFNTDSYLISPEKYPIVSGSSLTFWADNANDSYPENFSVCVATADNPTAADFTTVWSGGAKGSVNKGNGAKADVRHGTTRYENWRSHSIDLSDYAGQEVWIAFHDVNYDMYEIWIDDVELSTDTKGARAVCESFDIHRAHCDGSGTVLIASNISQNQYIDDTWSNIDAGSYKYGVCVVGGGSSDITWSNCLTKPNAITYTVTATANPTAGGTVSGAGTYNQGQSCTLTATANTGYTFVNWTKGGTVVSTNPTYTFTVAEDGDYIANFQANSYDITVTANPTAGGTVSGAGTYNQGQSCTLTATANTGYTFVNWTKGGTVVSTNATYTFTVAEDGDYVANFYANGSSITQTTDFVQGWTWWSPYIEAQGGMMQSQLENGLGDQGVLIKSQLHSRIYMAATGSWFGPLVMDNAGTYMVNTNAATVVSITGAEARPADYMITLNPGWTWIGYPCAEPMDINLALATLNPEEGDVLKSQMNASIYMAGQWRGAMSTLTPGVGLKYKSGKDAPVNFTYTTPVKTTEPVANPEETHWKANYNDYPTNMTVLAAIELDGKELGSDNYELAAFANGECRGAVRLIYIEPLSRYMALMTIAGEEDAGLCFGLYNTETGEEYLNATETLTFVTDAVVGTAEAPFIVSFRSNTGLDDWAGSLHIHPNPVERGQTVSLGLNSNLTGKVSVEVINMVGLVETRIIASPNTAMTLNAPKVPGVYTLRITIDGETVCRKLVVR